MNAFLYNVRFFLGCLRPRYWREYTAEYPNLRATVPPVARQTCGGTHVLRSVR